MMLYDLTMSPRQIAVIANDELIKSDLEEKRRAKLVEQVLN